jgi:glycosyltransferase involved in cell wall biosynthesis
MGARTRVFHFSNGVATPFGAAEQARRSSTLAPRLLSINNFFYRRGGSEAVFLEHNRLFEEAGWHVVPFAMRDPRNLSTPWAEYFAAPVELSGEQTLHRKLLAAGKVLYSFDARRRVRELVNLTRPTIAHAHNIYHHLSPSILLELRRQGVPVVMTLHDLKVACPAYKMFANGAVCERCRHGDLYNVVSQRCIKGSLGMSALIWVESTLHRYFDLYRANVTRFVVPSRFFLAKLIEWGFKASQFTYIPNFIETPAESATPAGHGYVYCGRLVPEKGVATLIRAATRAGVRLLIIGTGSEEAPLRQLAESGGGDIQFAGHLEGARLHQAIRAARAVVVPSEWYENAPISVMEASALGKPVIGARIGGVPELIREGETGLLFESANVEALEQVLRRVETMRDQELQAMGAAGQAWMRTEFSPAHYRERMLFLYSSLGVRR